MSALCFNGSMDSSRHGSHKFVQIPMTLPQHDLSRWKVEYLKNVHEFAECRSPLGLNGSMHLRRHGLHKFVQTLMNLSQHDLTRWKVESLDFRKHRLKALKALFEVQRKAPSLLSCFLYSFTSLVFPHLSPPAPPVLVNLVCI